VGAEQLAELVKATLIAHRDTFLTQAVRDEEWERVLSTGLRRDWIPQRAFDDLLAATIRHGLHVPRAIDAFLALFKGGMHADSASDHIETIIATQSDPVVRVHVGSTHGMEETSLSKEVRDRLFFATGVLFPHIKLVVEDRLAIDEFYVELNRLRAEVQHFGEGSPADTLADFLRSHAHVYTTTSLVDAALGRFALAFPMAVFNAIEVYSTTSVLRVLRALVYEGVDIRDLRTILGAMLEVTRTARADGRRHAIFPYEANLVSSPESCEAQSYPLLEYIRSQLKDQICEAHADPERHLHVAQIPAALETRLLRAEHDPLTEDETFDLLFMISSLMEKTPAVVVLLTSGRNRRRLWELVRHELPHVPVLCKEEISPYVHRIDVSERAWELAQDELGEFLRR
jgi:type III secretory pathway component EscV